MHTFERTQCGGIYLLMNRQTTVLNRCKLRNIIRLRNTDGEILLPEVLTLILCKRILKSIKQRGSGYLSTSRLYEL